MKAKRPPGNDKPNQHAKRGTSPIRRLAELIADDLFRSGEMRGGEFQYANRLVLSVDSNPARDLGGLCYRSVVDVIVRAFSESSKVDWGGK